MTHKKKKNNNNYLPIFLDLSTLTITNTTLLTCTAYNAN